MAMPIGGVRRPVTITDCTGQEVSITGGRLDVNAVVLVPGDTPQPTTATQDLAVAPLSFTDAIALIKEALWLALHFTGASGLLADEVLTVTLVSADGAAFDTVILMETLPTGTKDKFFSFPCDTLLRAADHIKVEVTNTGTPANTVTATLMEGS